MFEEDYIIRTIKEMVRALLKLVCVVDTESPKDTLLEAEQSREFWEMLKNSIDVGGINVAENQLSCYIGSGGKDAFKIALLFYSYLNEKDNNYLEENNYTREEIRTGLQAVASGYGLDGLADIF